MSAIPSVSSAAPASSTNAFNALSSEDFVRIMFTELTNQDPLAPSDTKAVLDQIGSIRSIESDLKLTSKLEALVSQNELASAGTLIGKFVSGLTDTGTRVGDLVLSVSATKNGATLNLASGDKIFMNRIEEIIDPAALEALSGASASTPGDSTSTPSTATSG
jgi:flagellar basal-body rod modification protein FlgD